ncbi:MAG: hypothetical protein WCQ95_14520, partial [Bacteroidota bacterium]
WAMPTSLIKCSGVATNHKGVVTKPSGVATLTHALLQNPRVLPLNYKQNSHASPAIYGIGANGSLKILHVVTGTEITNKGQGVVSFMPTNDLAGKIRATAIVIDPMCSATIPKGWTSIEVTNLSATLETFVSVRTK